MLNVGRAMHPLKPLWEGPSLSHPPSGVLGLQLQHFNPCLCCHEMVSICVSLCLLHFLPRHQSYWIRKKEKKVKSLSRIQLFAIPCTVAYQASPSMGFSRQEYWSGLPFSSPGNLPDPGIKPRSPALQADSLLSESPGKPLLDQSTL